jgi:hypothetical protein
MTATNDTLESYFQRMVDKTIQAVAIFDDELVIILDDGSEVCLWSDSGDMAIQVNEQPDLDS